MKILITGGAGFIGSHVVELLARKQHEIVVVDDLSTGKLEWIQPLIDAPRARVHFRMLRLQCGRDVNEIVGDFRPRVICHLAAQPAISTSWADPCLNAEINELGTVNLLSAAREIGVRRFIMTSTSAVYSYTDKPIRETTRCDPDTPYGISKLAGEMYVRAMSQEAVILRLGNVYGPRQVPLGENQVVPKMMRHLMYSESFSIHGDGNQTRDFVFVEDVAEAFLYSIYGKPGTYNVATGTSYSVNRLAEFVAGLYDQPAYAWPHDDQEDTRRGAHLDATAAYQGLGWKPSHTILSGLAPTADWWKSRK